MSIDDLVRTPSLQTKYLAGRSGSDRAVIWAHTCELSDPWNWLAPGDLLMTDGYAFPAKAEDQIAFLSRLEEAQIAGIALAEGQIAPRLTPEAALHADSIRLPVLATGYNVPFVTLSRVVAAGNVDGASQRLLKAQRLYNVLRRVHSSEESMDDLLDLLAAEIRVELHVLNIRTGKSYLPSGTRAPNELANALVALVQASSGRLPAFGRVVVGEATYIVLPVGNGSRAALVASAVAIDGSTPDLALLQHVATIADVEVERRASLEARARVRGTRLLSQLVDGTASLPFALAELSDLGLGEGPWRAILWSSTSRIGDLEAILFDLGVPLLHLRSERGHLIFLASRTPAEVFLNSHLTESAYSGWSRLINNLARVADGVREARWALDMARELPGERVVYGERVAPFFPRSMAEADEVVSSIIGVLIDYDEKHESELIRSLEVFFDKNRSWQEGARELQIHRQTLVYRMRRVEELTQRDLNKFGDQAELYFAIRVWRALRTDV